MLTTRWNSSHSSSSTMDSAMARRYPRGGYPNGMADEERPGAQQWVPEHPTIEGLRSAAQDCRGCELYRDATQAVMGRAAGDARLVLLGEQPGDQEDRQGE